MPGITERVDQITHISPDRLRSDPPCPKSVKIELTGRCNYRCGFCALREREKQPKGDMDFDLFKKMTLDMKASGVEEIGLFYLGESLMAPELTVKACEWVKEIGVEYVFLTTNGSLAEPPVVHGLMKAGLDSLKFSLNSDFEQFEKIMGVKKKLYEKALNNLKVTYEMRNSHGFKTTISASSIQLDGDQQQRMEALVEERIRPYVDEHYWLPLYSMGSVAKKREQELGYKPTAGNQGRVEALVDPLPCWAVMTEGHVRSDGHVSLCCFGADDRFDVGDLNTHSWMEIWNNEEFQKVRKAHLSKDLTGTVCEHCIAY